MSRRSDIAESLRRRILSSLRAGTLARGDRLPSARELGRQFGADPRVVLAAYRLLAAEGLAELRPRSGIFVAADAASHTASRHPASEQWVVETFLEGLAREIPAPDLASWLSRLLRTRKVRAAVISSTSDQLDGITIELRNDYGVTGESFRANRVLRSGARVPRGIRRADLLVTTPYFATRVRELADRLGLPSVVVDVRPDLLRREWLELLREPVYIVAVDPSFVDNVRRFLATTPGAENLRSVVVGEDDVGAIPEDSPVYVTRSARIRLRRSRISGRIIPPARTFSTEAARELLTIVVRKNLEAM